MRTAAGNHFVIADGDDADVLADRWRLAERERLQFFRRREPAADGHVALNVIVHVQLDAADILRGNTRDTVGHGDVNRGDLLADMQADRYALHRAVQRSGDHVVGCMLLHVIKAPGPVDHAVHGSAFAQRRGHRVPDVLILHVHVDNAGVAQRTRIKGLSAGCGIEGTAIQQHVVIAAVGTAYQHLRIKLGQIRVIVIESFGHDCHTPAVKFAYSVSAWAGDVKHSVCPQELMRKMKNASLQA